ncbi:putative nucleic acid-binding protein [Stella humosa]|uniref:Putative nucleic acid-binding protein n=1 Tax=Stella humosa TaxID=94 RepID=A0A3N1MET5_9PROT|nr:type II toxin-antitoxin system VapC family toxin [Stella humosa]ROQ01217.1 putative nucleic acid-binding protein [Stella humosa]BBK31591.1 twitching motility protein PilT [Stella humosa]
MTAFVLDCSVTLAWCFEDEASAATDALLMRLRSEGAIVPPIWSLEVINVLIQAQRRGRISPDEVTRQLRLLAALPIEIDAGALDLAATAVPRVAEAHGLTSYDAAYLELAIRRHLPIATKDRALIAAARRSGIPALPEGA